MPLKFVLSVTNVIYYKIVLQSLHVAGDHVDSHLFSVVDDGRGRGEVDDTNVEVLLEKGVRIKGRFHLFRQLQ